MQWTWLRRTSYSEKVTLLKKYLFLKNLFFSKSSCSEEPPASEKYMFWIITNSLEVVPPKHNRSCPEKVFILVADQKKVLVTRSSY